LLAEAETLQDIMNFLLTADPVLKETINTAKIIHHNEIANVDPSQLKTLIEVLLTYAEKTPNKAHIYFQTDNGTEEVITYKQLLTESLRVAQGLKNWGLKEGETVAIMQPTHPNFFYSFYGTLLAGAIPVPIYPPFRMHMLEAYAKLEARILKNAGVRILISFKEAEKLSHVLQSFVPSLKYVTTVKELSQGSELTSLYKANENNFAFIQYTSGSTNDPKGVLLSHYNLLSNIRAYGKTIKVTPEDVAVSWLPLYHDMGLIGMWLGSLYYGVPLILLTPFSFLNHPERWLWAIHYHRGTLSGAPNFAYELCVRKLDAGLLEGLDLSSWRMAANGAEKVYPKTLEEFNKKFAPYGLKKTTLLPVYGLAESTVALAIPPLDRGFLIDRVDRKEFEKNKIATPSTQKNALEFVACGVPMEGHAIKIMDDNRKELPERHVGSLYFKGPSSMQGYYNNPEATAAIYHDGWLDSGDLAYQVNGEVYITGRRKDLIIKAGRNLYPAEIEEIVGQIHGVRQGCVAVFEVSDDKRAMEKLVIVAETREKKSAELENIRAKIKEAVASNLDITPDDIVLVAPQIVPKTSSGKLQRAACKTKYLQGELGKQNAPAWMQITRLALQSFSKKLISFSKSLLKIFFTAYVVCVLFISLIPLYIIVRFSNRNGAARACQWWARFILMLGFCRIKIVNQEKLLQTKPVIYMLNHASYVDALVVLALFPINTRLVGKKELFSAPIFKTFMRKLDFVSIDRFDIAKGIEDTKQIETALKAGNSVVIFPEGTFGYSIGLRPFRLGGFKIAVDTDTPICPVALNGTRYILRDDEKLARPGNVIVTVCDTVQAHGKEWQDVVRLKDQVRSDIAQYCGEPSLDFIAAQVIAAKIQ